MAVKARTLAETLHGAGTLAALRQLAGRLASEVDAARDPYDVAKLGAELRLVLTLIAKCESAQPAPVSSAANAVDELKKRRIQRRATRAGGSAS